LIDNQTDQQ